MKKHIIWDFNGTLLGDAQLSVDCDNYVFDKLGLPHISIEDYRAHMTMPVRNFYTALGVDLAVYPYEIISRLWLDRFNQLAVEAGLVPGVLGVVRALHEAGYTQSVLSASYEPSLLEQCAQLGLTPYMQAINGLGDESATPKTEIGRRQMRSLSLAPEQVVLVGDMIADSELAEALGTQCVLVPWGHNSKERLKGTGRTIAGTCGELLSLLEEA
ncbi:MAG: HAD family hydrolase [Clostridia bacterium]|nr:HAD family hydrolase [Clostridia bacterium]